MFKRTKVNRWKKFCPGCGNPVRYPTIYCCEECRTRCLDEKKKIMCRECGKEKDNKEFIMCSACRQKATLWAREKYHTTNLEERAKLVREANERALALKIRREAGDYTINRPHIKRKRIIFIKKTIAKLSEELNVLESGCNTIEEYHKVQDNRLTE